MDERRSNYLFNAIAPVYGLFYKGQKKRFSRIIEEVENDLVLKSYDTILDVGCGTGALCSVLNEKGFEVTGADPAVRMLVIAKKKQKNSKINFVEADVLKGLPFEKDSFDISFASYVAHGLQENERKHMYAEMSRVTKSLVIIHDYNQKRALLTTIIEWLERGDYFNFIKNADEEMRNCISEMKECFSEVQIIDVDKRASWYICKPV